MATIDLSGLDALIKTGDIQGSSNGIGSTGQGGGQGGGTNSGQNAPLFAS